MGRGGGSGADCGSRAKQEQGVNFLYTVLLGQLPPKQYPTFEAAWDKCYYLDARRGCLCGRGGCRCSRYEEVKALLDEYSAIMLQAATIFIGDELPEKIWHVSFRRFVPKKRGG